MFALLSSPPRFTRRGWGRCPDLQMQNYLDIGKINVAEQNSSTRKVPRPGLRGGGRGGVPIEGARIFQFLKAKEQKSPPREDFTPSKQPAGRSLFEAQNTGLCPETPLKELFQKKVP